jgi:hypothetical protein
VPLICGSLKVDLILWQEGREGKQKLMSATVKEKKTRVGECSLETGKGSPGSRGEHDYVWDKL